ncbi:23S rRNA (pseudouridine(1915)-N(3))-methyltransferase RlmH [Alkalihalophilus marmarensis]|uniref:23S rRNA (pseudouridine1915-N3)-methyltransferase n=1 Tax=Alkalihalophilus marmarensis DSM 21297 TaxID=1188261 RepID=U6SIS6_9BACI|nr:23S rRNA (pseudouridine(1915)-N(3))-methyltransferase RlmH [Alkalihalophilus marmarensis]ERN51634.1 hypothetical protein A33I_20080 [Alkalihalophilus marmarensis DSM 21297]
MKINLLIVEPKIDKFIVEGIKEYKKRLGKYCKINIENFKNEDKLQKSISDNSYRILINTNTCSLTSEEFAHKINLLGIHGKSNISIIIGSSNILPDETLSINSMYLDNGIKALIMVEQVYRAFRILHNEPYHK